MLNNLKQLGDNLFSQTSPISQFTVPGADNDSFIEIIVVLSGSRLEIEQEQIPLSFSPITGKWKLRG
jgi:phenol 2-monooxygenase